VFAFWDKIQSHDGVEGQGVDDLSRSFREDDS
jgi:hypothetical protein